MKNKYKTQWYICEDCNEKSFVETNDPSEDSNICINHMCNGGKKKN